MSPYVPTALIRAQSDERLARLAALGSERAFEQIVERYRQPLLAYARRLVGESRAEDVVQASFVAAWTDLRRGSEIRELRAWLYRVVHNRSLNVLKRADNGDVPLLDAVRATDRGVAAEVEDRAAVRATLQEIAGLPERQRAAFLAVAVDGRRHREVGDELGLSEGAVKMLVSRARGTLRAAAGAVVPWPLLVRAAGLGGAAPVAGAGGTGLLGAGVLKAGAVLATAGALATAGPPALRAIEPGTPAAPAAARVAPAATVLAPGAPVRGGLGADALAPAGTRAPSGAPAVPGPAPAIPAVTPDTAPVAPMPAAPAVEHASSETDLPHQDFLTPAAEAPVDDDLIVVTEDPPDVARGEQAIGPDGVPDVVADAIPGDAPDPGDDPAGEPLEDDGTPDAAPAPADAGVSDAAPAPAPAADQAPADSAPAA